MQTVFKTNSKLLGLFLLAMLVLSNVSCMFKEGIHGNGIVEKETRNVPAFNQLDISGTFNVFLSQGETASVTIEADNNIIPIIQTDVDQNKLSVKIENGVKISKSKKSNVYITVTDLNSLHFNGVGNLKCLTDLNLSTVDIYNSGVGNMELKGSALVCTMHNSGVGNLNAFDFEVQKLNISNAGVGNVQINAVEELSMSNSGVGNVSYKGDASIKELHSSGVGKIVKR